MTDFAELHYTALTRLLCAIDAAGRIEPLCLEVIELNRPAKQILSLQSALLTFFACAGATVEHLNKAYEAKPCKGRGLFTGPADVEGTPNWFYDRRTQYLHKRLVPIFPIHGVLHLDASVFAAKSVVWEREARTTKEITAFIDTLVDDLVKGMTTGWSTIYTRLRQVAPIRTAPPGGGLRITSGSPFKAG